jgi:Flp pilus assembly protein CpaB
MKSKILVALLVAASTFVAVPAFASGYGPAPSYRPSVGAPASQRGQSAQIVATVRDEAAGSVNDSYGGVVAPSSQSGVRQPAQLVGRMYAGH